MAHHSTTTATVATAAATTTTTLVPEEPGHQNQKNRIPTNNNNNSKAPPANDRRDDAETVTYSATTKKHRLSPNDDDDDQTTRLPLPTMEFGWMEEEQEDNQKESCLRKNASGSPDFWDDSEEVLLFEQAQARKEAPAARSWRKEAPPTARNRIHPLVLTATATSRNPCLLEDENENDNHNHNYKDEKKKKKKKKKEEDLQELQKKKDEAEDSSRFEPGTTTCPNDSSPNPPRVTDAGGGGGGHASSNSHWEDAGLDWSNKQKKEQKQQQQQQKENGCAKEQTAVMAHHSTTTATVATAAATTTTTLVPEEPGHQNQKNRIPTNNNNNSKAPPANDRRDDAETVTYSATTKKHRLSPNDDDDDQTTRLPLPTMEFGWMEEEQEDNQKESCLRKNASGSPDFWDDSEEVLLFEQAQARKEAPAARSWRKEAPPTARNRIHPLVLTATATSRNPCLLEDENENDNHNHNYKDEKKKKKKKKKKKEDLQELQKKKDEAEDSSRFEPGTTTCPNDSSPNPPRVTVAGGGGGGHASSNSHWEDAGLDWSNKQKKEQKQQQQQQKENGCAKEQTAVMAHHSTTTATVATAAATITTTLVPEEPGHQNQKNRIPTNNNNNSKAPPANDRRDDAETVTYSATTKKHRLSPNDDDDDQTTRLPLPTMEFGWMEEEQEDNQKESCLRRNASGSPDFWDDSEEVLLFEQAQAGKEAPAARSWRKEAPPTARNRIHPLVLAAGPAAVPQSPRRLGPSTTVQRTTEIPLPDVSSQLLKNNHVGSKTATPNSKAINQAATKSIAKTKVPYGQGDEDDNMSDKQSRKDPKIMEHQDASCPEHEQNKETMSSSLDNSTNSYTPAENAERMDQLRQEIWQMEQQLEFCCTQVQEMHNQRAILSQQEEDDSHRDNNDEGTFMQRQLEQCIQQLRKKIKETKAALQSLESLPHPEPRHARECGVMLPTGDAEDSSRFEPGTTTCPNDSSPNPPRVTVAGGGGHASSNSHWEDAGLDWSNKQKKEQKQQQQQQKENGCAKEQTAVMAHHSTTTATVATAAATTTTTLVPEDPGHQNQKNRIPTNNNNNSKAPPANDRRDDVETVTYSATTKKHRLSPNDDDDDQTTRLPLPTMEFGWKEEEEEDNQKESCLWRNASSSPDFWDDSEEVLLFEQAQARKEAPAARSWRKEAPPTARNRIHPLVLAAGPAAVPQSPRRLGPSTTVQRTTEIQLPVVSSQLLKNNHVGSKTATPNSKATNQAATKSFAKTKVPYGQGDEDDNISDKQSRKDPKIMEHQDASCPEHEQNKETMSSSLDNSTNSYTPAENAERMDQLGQEIWQLEKQLEFCCTEVQEMHNQRAILSQQEEDDNHRDNYDEVTFMQRQSEQCIQRLRKKIKETKAALQSLESLPYLGPRHARECGVMLPTGDPQLSCSDDEDDDICDNKSCDNKSNDLLPEKIDHCDLDEDMGFRIVQKEKMPNENTSSPLLGNTTNNSPSLTTENERGEQLRQNVVQLEEEHVGNFTILHELYTKLTWYPNGHQEDVNNELPASVVRRLDQCRERLRETIREKTVKLQSLDLPQGRPSGDPVSPRGNLYSNKGNDKVRMDKLSTVVETGNGSHEQSSSPTDGDIDDSSAKKEVHFVWQTSRAIDYSNSTEECRDVCNKLDQQKTTPLSLCTSPTKVPIGQTEFLALPPENEITSNKHPQDKLGDEKDACMDPCSPSRDDIADYNNVAAEVHTTPTNGSSPNHLVSHAKTRLLDKVLFLVKAHAQNLHKREKADVLSKLSESDKRSFGQVGFYKYGPNYLPALTLNPYSVHFGLARKKWIDQFQKAKAKQTRYDKPPHLLIYWCGETDPSNLLSVVEPSEFVPLSNATRKMLEYAKLAQEKKSLKLPLTLDEEKRLLGMQLLHEYQAEPNPARRRPFDNIQELAEHIFLEDLEDKIEIGTNYNGDEEAFLNSLDIDDLVACIEREKLATQFQNQRSYGLFEVKDEDLIKDNDSKDEDFMCSHDCQTLANPCQRQLEDDIMSAHNPNSKTNDSCKYCSHPQSLHEASSTAVQAEERIRLSNDNAYSNSSKFVVNTALTPNDKNDKNTIMQSHVNTKKRKASSLGTTSIQPKSLLSTTVQDQSYNSTSTPVGQKKLKATADCPS
ncbi:hypothetical protein ACA910_011960 [Epithemia clementina (nom. ined.)]